MWCDCMGLTVQMQCTECPLRDSVCVGVRVITHENDVFVCLQTTFACVEKLKEQMLVVHVCMQAYAIVCECVCMLQRVRLPLDYISCPLAAPGVMETMELYAAQPPMTLLGHFQSLTQFCTMY